MAERRPPPTRSAPATPREPAAKRTRAAKRNPAASKPGAKPAKKKDVAHRRAVVRTALATVVFVGLLFAFVYPTRTYLDQRSDTKRARAQLELLRTENDRLEREAENLQSDAEIERRAREYGLVRPGEQPFVIIPAPTTAPPPTGP